MTGPQLIELADDQVEHELLNPYRDIRSRNWTTLSGIFIAEGPLLTERLLASDYGVHSVLVEHKMAERFAPLVPSSVPLVVVSHRIVEQLVGFNFHRGVLSCGLRKPVPELSARVTGCLDAQDTWLGLIGVQDPENVGGMLRTAAGLGIRNILIGPGTADPLSRRALRVSMGNTLQLQLYRAHEVAAALNELSRQGVELVATSLRPGSQPLEQARRRGPMILLMGNEKHGLDDEVLSRVDRGVRIDMALSTDSLNVCVAAGIVMHHFCRIAPTFSP